MLYRFLFCLTCFYIVLNMVKNAELFPKLRLLQSCALPFHDDDKFAARLVLLKIFKLVAYGRAPHLLIKLCQLADYGAPSVTENVQKICKRSADLGRSLIKDKSAVNILELFQSGKPVFLCSG